MSQPDVICKRARLDCETLLITVATGGGSTIAGPIAFTGAVTNGVINATTINSGSIFNSGAIATASLAATGNVTATNATFSNNATVSNLLTATQLNAVVVSVNPTGNISFPKESTQGAINGLVVDGAGAFDGTMAFTSVSHPGTQARTDAAAVTVSSHKFGGFITTDVRATGLAASSNALGASPIIIVGGIAAGYRPQAAVTISCVVTENAVVGAGQCVFATNGDITIQPLGLANFTNGALCAFQGASYTYAMF